MKDKRYIVDTSVIMQYPDILNVSIPDGRILIPDVVLKEIGRSAKYNNTSLDYINLINDAQSSGLLKIINSRTADENEYIGAKTVEVGKSIKGADIGILLLAKELSNKGRYVVVVTDDSELSRGSKRLGLMSMSGQELLGKIRDLKHSSELFAGKVRHIRRKAIFNSALSLCVGVISGLLAGYLNVIGPWIINAINAWGFVVGVILLSLVFYWLRQNYRLSYGAAEYAFGLFTAIRVIKNDLYTSGINIIYGLQVIAGFYIMVRGLDNITKGLSGKRWFPIWKKVFSE